MHLPGIRGYHLSGGPQLPVEKRQGESGKGT